MDRKTCSQCDTEFPRDQFYRHKFNRDGLTGKCKECCKAYQRRRYTTADEMQTLYVAYNDRIPGEVKVGASGRIRERQAESETCQNFRIVIAAEYPGAGHLESKVHRLLASERVTRGAGREWFAVSVDFARAAIEEVMAREVQS